LSGDQRKKDEMKRTCSSIGEEINTYMRGNVKEREFIWLRTLISLCNIVSMARKLDYHIRRGIF
jgi:hypothetical protein